VERRIVGGLLGHWAVWTHAACQLLEQCHRATGLLAAADRPAGARDRDLQDLLDAAVAITDMNAALFDAAHNYAGCIPGIHEVLRQQGLFETTVCLDPQETLSPGQVQEIDRVRRSYPRWVDDEFVQQHRDQWL